MLLTSEYSDCVGTYLKYCMYESSVPGEQQEQKKRLRNKDNPDAAAGVETWESFPASEVDLGAAASVTAKASRNAR